jgi:hypothetical protein
LLDQAESIVHGLTEWTQGVLEDCFQEAAQRLGQMKEDVKMKDQVISNLETKCKRYSQEE